MIGRNWDKPVPFEDLTGVKFYEKHFNDYHGTIFRTWNDLYLAISKTHLDVGPDKFYNDYLQYCKLQCSPLMKALA